MRRLTTFVFISLIVATLSACSNLKVASKSSTSLASFLGLSELPDWYVNEKYDYLDSQWIDNDFGHRIHYRDVGEGPLIVLLHGELSSLHTWDKWIETLKEEYRIIAVDLPGSGLTGAPHCINDPEDTCSENLSFDYLNHTLRYFVEDLNLPSFTLVGSSYGGYLALNYALDTPNKVNNLVLISPVGFQQEIPDAIDYVTSGATQHLNYFIQPSGVVTSAIQDYYGANKNIPRETVRRYVHLAQSDGARESNMNQLKLVRKVMEQGTTRAISELSVPTMIVWGGTDQWGDPSHAEIWNQEIKDSILIKYSNLGHVPMEEDPETTLIDFMAYLKGDDIPTLIGLGSGDIFTIGDAEQMFQQEDLFGSPAPAPEAEEPIEEMESEF